MDAQDGRTRARCRGRCAAIAAGAVVALGVASSPAAAVIVPEPNPDTVAQAIINDPATLDLAGTDWQELATTPPAVAADPFPAAVSSLALGGFPTAATSFGILSTGDVALVDTPNDSESTGAALAEVVDDGDATDKTDNGALHGDTDNDVTVLRMAVNVPPGANCISLDYRFLTDEFPEYVNETYNDAFIAEIDNLTWSTSNDVISHTGDFATTPAGEPVSVDGVGGAAMTAEDAAGTTFDGATGRVTTKNPITPGAHNIYLSVFDQGDEIFDSVVLLDRLAFLNESPATCKPPEVPAIVPPPPPPPSPLPGPPAPLPPPNDFTVPGSSVIFGNGSATVIVNVPGPGVVTATDASAGVATRVATAAAKKKKLLIKPARAVATKAGPVKLKIKPTKAGKKILRKKKKLKVSLAITFTPTGGSPHTEVTKLTIKVKKHRKK